jgi:hypothetical protein
MALRFRWGFPIVAAVGDFIEDVAVRGEQRGGLGPAFDGARFAAAQAAGDKIFGEGLHEIAHEFGGLFLAARLRAALYWRTAS